GITKDSPTGSSLVPGFILRASLCAAGLALAVFVVPWPGAVQCPGIVECADLIRVRTAAPGLVASLHVADGDLVEPGQLLAVLKNEELENECRDLVLAVEQSQVKSRICLEQSEIAAAQIESSNREALEKRLAEKQSQHD